MRVLLLSRYGSLGASSRVRFYQYLPWLRAQGLTIDVAPLLPDDYVRALYDGRRWGMLAVAAAYGRRLRTLLACRDYDLLWIEYELFPWLPAWFEQWLGLVGIPYLADYDDAIFHRYDAHRSAWVRALLGAKIDKVMRHAAVVTAGNDYLAARASRVGAPRVALVPTSIDLEKYPVAASAARETFRVGWIGSPATSSYLETLHAPLSRFCAGRDARVVLIGARDPAWRDVPYERVTWREEDETEAISRFDVGIMPLPDAPWERGKCGYKLIQYMACGKPVVASPVGVNRQIVEHGINGFLAQSPEEWEQALATLARDANLRMRMGAAGRDKVERAFCVQVNAPRVLECLRMAAGIDSCAV